MKQNKSLIAFIACAIFLFGSPFLTKKWNNSGSQAVISWDICGYYLYLPSFFYDDLGQLNNYDYIQKTYHPGSDAKDMAFIQPTTGKYVMNYPCGQALMYLPAFGVAHLWAITHGYKADGFTLPYQITLDFWCVIVGCFGLWILRKLLLRYFDDWIVGVLILILCLATNFYNFVSYSPMSHAYLFTLYALILYMTDSFYRDNRYPLWRVVLIGLLSGLATITRPTEIICALIPLLWGVRNWSGFKDRLSIFLKKPSVVIVYILSAFLAALPQLLYWKYYAGHWLFFSYHGDDKTFSFLKPHIRQVLFSYQKGWFIYTPVMFLSIIGFYQLYKNYRNIFWCIAAFTILNIYLVSAWDIWWYGGSFSMRALIQSYSLLLFPLGAFLADMLRRPYWKYLIAAMLVFFVWLNLLMTYQANGSFKVGIMEGEGITAAYYWRVFGRTEIAVKDKKLLDTNEEMPEKFEPGLKSIYDINFSDSAHPAANMYADKRSVKLDAGTQWSDTFYLPINADLRKGWYRIFTTVNFPDKEWNTWKQTQLTVVFTSENKSVKQKSIRLQRILDAGWWREAYLDVKIPNKSYDKVGVFFWNAGSEKAIYISDIKMDYTPEN